MIKTYKNKDNDKVKVFFTLNEDDEISSVKVGNMVISLESGYQFYVDSHIAEQIEKIGIDFTEGKPNLIIKEGETIELPQKNEKEKEIERLEKELRELRDAE